MTSPQHAARIGRSPAPDVTAEAFEIVRPEAPGPGS
ncbi:hypothetical protein ruthe_01788 [Rubellimicrobium thermophilum DSM 16684]|uniref:Uncharacterized protein n=1 Tax=Rubellimicrobium thermophilum DSM 16684 TaxID=1123069 RepID=S9QUY9_9RHOB|nr:hypothetical protein ruthe_01788 [Rubellimicrobium thermophilum DSM 16684]